MRSGSTKPQQAGLKPGLMSVTRGLVVPRNFLSRLFGGRRVVAQTNQELWLLAKSSSSSREGGR